MVDPLIPRLEQLCFSKNSFNITGEFVERFVKQHKENWILAERHWENIVARVLNTDAVDVNASRRRAIHQAVTATVSLLEGTGLRERCPVCAGAEPSRPKWDWLTWWRRWA